MPNADARSHQAPNVSIPSCLYRLLPIITRTTSLPVSSSYSPYAQ